MGKAVVDFLSPDDVFIDLVASDKPQLLRELSRRAAARLGLDEASVTNEILNRESLGSTGVGNGVAIPHARLIGLINPFAILARLRRPIEFDAIDGKPVDLVFLLLMRGDNEVGQINVLAAVARKLRSPDTLTRLRNARNAPELYEAIGSD